MFFFFVWLLLFCLFCIWGGVSGFVVYLGFFNRYMHTQNYTHFPISGAVSQQSADENTISVV